MTAPGRLPIRLLAEALLIAVVAALCVVSLQQWLVPQLPAGLAALIDAAALAFIAAPPLYWRVMEALRQAAIPYRPPPSPGAAAARPEMRRRRALAMTTAAYVAGLVVTAAAVSYLKVRIDADAHRQFDQQVERLHAEILRRFEQPVYGLKGARGMYAASRRIDRAQFQAYVESRNLKLEFPGVQGFGFMQRVMRGDLDAFTATERADGAPDFAVRGSGAAPDLYVVKYIEPLPPNIRARGFDLGSEPVRREAIERAVDTGEATLSGDLILGFGERRAPGFLILVPIYRQGTDPMTSAQRHLALVGLVYAPIFAADMLRGVLGAADSSLDFDLLHSNGADRSAVVFGVHEAAAPARGHRGASGDRAHLFETQRSLSTGGRELTLRASTSPSFEAGIDRRPLAFVGVGGTALSLLLALAVWSLASGRLRAQTLAERMTADLNRLAQVARHTSNAVSITDRNRRITWINEGFTRLSGYDIEAAQGRTPGELLASGNAEADADAARHIGAAVAEGKACRVEILNRARDGREYWTDTELQPVHDAQGVLVGFMEIGSDITDSKRADEALRRNVTMLNAILDNLPCGLSVFDGELQLQADNHQFRSLLGLPDELFAGGGTSFESIIRHNAETGEYGPGETQPKVDLLMDRARHPVPHHSERTRGNGVSIDIRGAPMPGGGFVTTYTDVSERKLVEAQVRVARDLAEQANAAKSQFLANMSHEIRTPMNAILGMLRLLQHTELSTRQLDYADKTERAARTLLRLLNDILDFSKVEAGKMALDPRPFQLDALLRDLSVILSANLGKKNVEVLFDVDPAVPRTLVGDDLRLQQVLLNLAGNALKFTSHGEVVIGVRVLEQSAATSLLEFSIRDTGIGIAPEQQQHVFSGFSQAEASTTRRFGGTGLGLSISQRLVGLMGGEIELDSEPGRGSTFSFRLAFPIVPETATATDTALAVPALEAGLCALVVDDNPTARGVLATMVRSLGWSVELAAGGSEALALIAQRELDGKAFGAVFVDWEMPGMDGWETSRRIRERAGHRALLLLMVTAHDREALASRPVDEQALLDGFVVKPVTASMLLDAVIHARTADGATGVGPAVRAPAESEPRLAGLRLLLVEDNLYNQQVAQELLEAEGASVTLASDGEQGVAAVAAADPQFDVVLMDVQMPVMDGYVATAHIRQELGLTDLPIIAMTANAMASDREASLAAGMNGHVGKPFDLDDLVDVLRRHAPLRVMSRPAAAQTRSIAIDVPEALLADAECKGVELAVAVRRLGGRAEVWMRTAASFAADLPRSADEFDEFLRTGKREDARRLAHTLRGLGATLGAMRLTHAAEAAETSLAGPESPESSARLAGRMRDVIAQTSVDMAGIVERWRQLHGPAPASATAAGRDAPALRAQLLPLAELLRESDMAATDRFADLVEAQESQWEEELKPLGAAIAGLDFELALRECEQLVRTLEAS